MSDIAIKVNNLSKRYRIGIQEEKKDTLLGTLVSILKTPITNIKKIAKLTKFENSFDDKEDIIWALKNVSFEIKKGEILGVIGQNGAGKSTLLKILARVTHATDGEIEINGRVSSILEVGTGFHPELTGRENIYLNGTILGMTKTEIDQKFDEIVHFSGIEKFIDTPVKRYSSGMGVRLAFSVAAHLDPDILIIDEVLAVGDIKFQERCIGKLNKSIDEGRTVLFVSHNMEVIERLCKRAILLDSGSIVSDGPTKSVLDLYLDSSSINIKNFLGERVWNNNNAPGNEIVNIKTIRTRNKKGDIPNFFNITETIILEIEYFVKDKVLPIGFSLILSHNQRAIIGSFDNHIKHKWGYQPIHEKGLFKTKCIIPGNLLNEGIYNVDLWIYSPPIAPDENPHVRLLSAIQFNVIDEKNGDGARGSFPFGLLPLPSIRPLLVWEKERL